MKRRRKKRGEKSDIDGPRQGSKKEGEQVKGKEGRNWLRGEEKELARLPSKGKREDAENIIVVNWVVWEKRGNCYLKKKLNPQRKGKEVFLREKKRKDRKEELLDKEGLLYQPGEKGEKELEETLPSYK